MKITRSKIKEIIPHREPFLLLNEVTEYEPGKWGKGYFIPDKDDFYFKGHFPGNPVLPGVLMIESAAQLGAFVVLNLPEFRGKTAYFAGIERVRFKRIVRPGEKLEISVELEKIKSGIGKGIIEGFVDGETCFKGELLFAIR